MRFKTLPVAFAAAVAVGAMLAGTFLPAQDRCPRPWMFFDLGNTLVDTKTYDFKKILYMPKAYDYLRELRGKGYPLGLLVNIPESWGTSRAEKVARLKAEVSGPTIWIDHNPMVWEFFTRTVTDDLILIPMKDNERKPGSPKLFDDAHALGSTESCPAVFQGEDPAEVSAAKARGMKGYLIGQDSDIYLPESKIAAFVNTH